MYDSSNTILTYPVEGKVDYITTGVIPLSHTQSRAKSRCTTGVMASSTHYIATGVMKAMTINNTYPVKRKVDLTNQGRDVRQQHGGELEPELWHRIQQAERGNLEIWK